jgi:uncharacterized protein YjiS (DUF1127 family)
MDHRSSLTSSLSPTLSYPLSPVARGAAAWARPSAVVRVLASTAGILAFVGWLASGAIGFFIAGALGLGACATRAWIAGGRKRRAVEELADMNPHLLDDIGLSRDDVLRESGRWFWQGEQCPTWSHEYFSGRREK